MSAGIVKLVLPVMGLAELERIRRVCIEEGLLEEGELLDLEDFRWFTA